MSYLYHNNEGVAYAFLNTLFSRFGTLVEIFIDLSKTKSGEFQEM